MLFLIEIHWERTQPHPDKPATDHTTYPVAARYRTAAFRKAQRQFRHQYGGNLKITDTKEQTDPAEIYS